MQKIHRQALLLIQNNDWDGAHHLVQNYHDPLSCQIHGYLHLIEGDNANASYWYHRAGITTPNSTLAEELKRLAAILTESSN
jgi:hypothetical protein